MISVEPDTVSAQDDRTPLKLGSLNEGTMENGAGGLGLGWKYGLEQCDSGQTSQVYKI